MMLSLLKLLIYALKSKKESSFLIDFLFNPIKKY